MKTYEYIKESTVGEEADIESFVITDINMAQTALWTVYESVQFVRRLSPLPSIQKKKSNNMFNLQLYSNVDVITSLLACYVL